MGVQANRASNPRPLVRLSRPRAAFLPRRHLGAPGPCAFTLNLISHSATGFRRSPANSLACARLTSTSFLGAVTSISIAGSSGTAALSS
jgi:hypothetical protein